MRRSHRLAGLAAGMIAGLSALGSAPASAPVATVAQQAPSLDRATVRHAPARQSAPTSTKTIAATATKRFMRAQRAREDREASRYRYGRRDSWRIVKPRRGGAVAVLRSS